MLAYSSLTSGIIALIHGHKVDDLLESDNINVLVKGKSHQGSFGLVLLISFSYSVFTRAEPFPESMLNKNRAC